MDPLFAWLETTALAGAIAESLTFTASLSAVHLLGFTLVMGGALLYNLRRIEWLFPQASESEVLRAANRAIVVGLAISLSTGALLFAAQATTVSANGTFQLKMLLLATAATFHFAFGGRYMQRAISPSARVGAVLGLSLWAALAVTACAFILLE